MQDIEFTIQDGELFILQTRSGKRTVFAALNMAVDMAEEGLIDRETALMGCPRRTSTNSSPRSSTLPVKRAPGCSPGG
jgi:phosphoenolpyruvate synthase/pyruvate phosphate dikinase